MFACDIANIQDLINLGCYLHACMGMYIVCRSNKASRIYSRGALLFYYYEPPTANTVSNVIHTLQQVRGLHNSCSMQLMLICTQCCQYTYLFTCYMFNEKYCSRTACTVQSVWLEALPQPQLFTSSLNTLAMYRNSKLT